MANDSCGPTPAPSEPVQPGTRMVHCVKFGKEMPGLDRVPWRGELGKRVYENVSKDAWKLWVEHSKMIRWNSFSLGKVRNCRKGMWRRRRRGKSSSAEWTTIPVVVQSSKSFPQGLKPNLEVNI
jgi:Fe-S cluster biosynthesis and repair protein YggX